MRSPPLTVLKRSGVHLEAIGIGKWRLSGDHETVTLELVNGRWRVNDGVVATYSSAGTALAHAYQLARGDSHAESLEY